MPTQITIVEKELILRRPSLGWLGTQAPPPAPPDPAASNSFISARGFHRISEPQHDRERDDGGVNKFKPYLSNQVAPPPPADPAASNNFMSARGFHRVEEPQNDPPRDNGSVVLFPAHISPTRQVRVVRGRPLLNRVLEADSEGGKRRLDRLSQVVSEVFNSLSTKNRLARSGLADWEIVGAGSNVFDRAPGPIDDEASGFRVGALWVNTITHSVYICLDNTVNAAIWKTVTIS